MYCGEVACSEFQPCPQHPGELKGPAANAEEPAVSAEVKGPLANAEGTKRIVPVIVVIATDGSDETERAVLWALDILTGPQFVFHAVHAYDWHAMGAGLSGGFLVEVFRRQAEAQARAVLHKISGLFQSAGRRAALCTNVGLRGDVQEIIPSYIRKNQCDLLVAGSRGKVGVQRWLRSVSNSLLHEVPCAVALVKQVDLERYPEAPRNLVLALDGSNHSRKAYEWARGHVLQPNDMVSIVMAFNEYEASDKALLESERDFASGLCLEVTKITGNDCHLFLLPGDPRQVVVDVVAKVGRVDLLVMGSRGRGSLASLILGSVTNYCAAAVSCPLLVVK